MFDNVYFNHNESNILIDQEHVDNIILLWGNIFTHHGISMHDTQ